MFYVNGNILNALLFTVSSSYEAQSLRSFDDGKQDRYFVSLLYVHMRGTGNVRLLDYIGGVTGRCHSDL